MLKHLFSLIITLASFSTYAQTMEGYTMDDDGMQYKIIADGKHDLLKMGDFMELHFTSIIKGANIDSVLNSSRESGTPQIVPFDSTSLPPNYYKIFAQLGNGDSVSTIISTDSIINKQDGQGLPPFIQRGMFIYTNIKLVNVYKSQAEADSAKQEYITKQEIIDKNRAAIQMSIDEKIIAQYLADNKITTTKSPKGTYVQITKIGTGAKIDKTKFIKVKYKGKTLDGHIFDTNMDNSKGHTEPLLVNLTDDISLGNGVIPGMADAFLTMQKGTKAMMYIPSTLGYGTRGAGADIAPNANLIFEVEVLEVLTKAQAVGANAKKMPPANKKSTTPKKGIKKVKKK